MTININLLPWREEQKEFQKRQFMTWIGLSAMLAATVVAGVHFFIQHQIADQQELNDYLKREIRVLDRQIEEIKSLKKERSLLLDRMSVIQHLQSSRPLIVHLFDTLTRTVPDGLYLTSVVREGDKLTIEGKAESNSRVSTFMRNIESSHWLRNPRLSIIQADDETKGLQNSQDSLITFTLQVSQVTKGQ